MHLQRVKREMKELVLKYRKKNINYRLGVAYYIEESTNASGKIRRGTDERVEDLLENGSFNVAPVGGFTLEIDED